MARKGDPGRRDPRAILNKNAGSYPACFNSSREYHQWLLLLRISKDHPGVGFCVDCTPEYKMEMMSEGRCAHPETQFIVRRNSMDPDQVEIVGVSSKSVYWAKVETGSPVVDGAEYGKDQQQNERQDSGTRADW